MKRPARGARRYAWRVAAIGVVYFLVAGAFVDRVPFGAAPDERPHLDYVAYLVENHRLPVLGEGSPEQFEYHQPPLYYLICAPVYAVLDNGERAADDVGRGVRRVSLVIGWATVCAALWAIGEAFGADARLVWPTVFCIALLPMFVFLSASVNNDNLVNLLFAIALGVGARMAHRGPTWGTALALGICAGLGALTKVIGLLLIPIGLCAIWIPSLSDPGRRRAALWPTVLFLVASMAFAGPWLARNRMVYGDALGQKAFMQYFGDRNAKPTDLFRVGWTPAEYASSVTTYSLKSMLGVFGHMDRWLPGWVYAVFGVVLAAGIAGVIVWFGRGKAQTEPGVRRAIGFWAAAFLIVFLFYVEFNTRFFQAQARYMFPAIVPIVCGTVLGVTRLAPARARLVVAWAIAAALFAVSVGAAWGYDSLATHM